VRDLSAVGATGVLTVATRGDDGPGEVMISLRGGSEAFLAWSAQPLPKGTEIVVIDTVGPRTVRVVRSDDAGFSGFDTI
jgi:hypothetical protein